MFCPNINTKEWNDLVKAVGEPMAYYLWNEYEGEVPDSYYKEPVGISYKYQAENETEVKAWFQKNLPQVERNVVDTLVDVNNRRVDSWGYFHNGVITVVQNAMKGTSYHEAFHSVYRNMLTTQEKAQVLLEVHEKYGEPSTKEIESLMKDYGVSEEDITITDKEPFINLWAEEKLADDFADYVNQFQEEESKKSWIRKFFDKIMNLFNWFSNKDSLSKTIQLFSKINSGQFADRSHIVDNKELAYLAAEPAFARKKDIPNIGPNYKLIRAKSIADQFRVKFLSYRQLGINKKASEIIDEIFNDYVNRAKQYIADPTPSNKKKLQNMLFMVHTAKDSNGNVISNAIENRRILLAEATDILREQGLLVDFDNEQEVIEVQKVHETSPEENETMQAEDLDFEYKSSQTTKGLGDYTSIPGLSHASTRLKLALSTLRKYKTGTKEFDSDDIGDPIYMDMLKTYYYVERNLINLYSIDDQVNELQILADSYPELDQLIAQLTDESLHASKEDFDNFRNDFKTNFTKQQHKYIMVLFSKDEEFNVKVINANRRDIMTDVAKEWKSNLTRRDKETIAVFDKSTDTAVTTHNEKTENLEKVWTAHLGNDEVVSDKLIKDTLLKVGIELSDITFNEIVKSEKDKAVNHITAIIKYHNSAEPNKKLSQSYGEAKKYFLEKEVKQRFDLFTSSFNDADNKNIYTIQLPTFASELVTKLTTLDDKKFNDFYNNLMRDPKYKYNTLLNKLKENALVGKRPLRTEVFQMFIIDGLKNEGASKGVKFMKMDLKDFLFNDVSLFADAAANENREIGAATSKHTYLVPADKKLQMVFDMPIIDVTLGLDGKLSNEESIVHRTFHNVVKAEIGRMQQAVIQRNKIEQGYVDTLPDGTTFTWDESKKIKHYHYAKDSTKWDGLAYKFNYLPELNYYKMGELKLVSNILDAIKKDPSATTEGIFSQFVTDINLGLTMILNDKLQKQLNQFETTNLVSLEEGKYKNQALPKGFIKEAKTEDLGIKNATARYAFNKLLNNIELSQLLNGDVANYKANDLIKRAYQSNSMVSKGNFTGTMKVGIVNDIIRNTKNPKTKSENEPQFLDDFRHAIDKMVRGGFLSREKGDHLLDLHAENNVTDATSWVSPEFFKRLYTARGVWNDDLQNAYDAEENGKVLTPKEAKRAKAALAGIKPFYYGVVWSDAYQMYIPVQLKTFFVPLFKSITDYNPVLAKKKAEMKDKGIDMLATDSVAKAFLPVTKNITDSVDNSFSIPMENLGVQVDNVQHMVDDENDAQRQIKMIIHGAIDKSKVYNVNGSKVTGEELHNRLDSIEAENYLQSTDDTVKKMQNKDGSFLVDLHESLTRRNATEAMHKLFEVSGNEFVFPLFNGPFNIQGQNMITSVFTKNISKQKFSGGSAVSTSSMGFAFKNLKEQQEAVDNNDYLKATQSELKIVFNEDGTLSHYEAAMSAFSSDFYNEDGSVKDASSIPVELRTILTWRIPTEEIHSVVPVIVTKFLDPKLGNYMLMPENVTTQLGEDFDFDKRYFASPHYIKVGDKFIVPKYSTGTTDGDAKIRYEIYKSIQNKRAETMVKKIDNLGLGFELIGKILEIEKENKAVSFEEFKTWSIARQNSKEARDNQILSIYKTVITDANNFEGLFTKSNFDRLGEVKDALKKKMDEYKEAYNISSEEEANFFTGAYQAMTKVNNAVGADMKGQAANHTTSHAWFTKLDANLKNPFYISGQPHKLSIDRGMSRDTTAKEFKSMSNMTSPDGYRIGDRLGQLLAGVLDDLKNPFLNFIGLNSSTVDIYAMFIRAGLNESQAIGILSHPIVKEISKKINANNSQIKDSGEGRFIIDNQVNTNEAHLLLLDNLTAPQIQQKYEKDRNYLGLKPSLPQLKFNNSDLSKSGKLTKYFGLSESEEFYYANKKAIDEFNKIANIEDMKKFFQKYNLTTNLEAPKASLAPHIELNQANLYNFALAKQRLTLAFKGFKSYADNIVEINRFFALNKELGPDMETVMEKLYLWTKINNGTNGIQFGNNLKTIDALVTSAEKELEELSRNYPYNSSSYAKVKEAVVDQLVKNNPELSQEEKLVSLKKELRTKINTFIDFYLTFADSNFKGSMNKAEVKRLVTEVPDKLIAYKSIANMEKYGNLRDNPFFAYLSVDTVKGSPFKAIQFKGNRQDTSVKNAFTRSMLELFQDNRFPEYQKFVLDAIKYSHIYSGFHSGLDSFHTLIDPDILASIGFTDTMRKQLHDMNTAQTPVFSDETVDHIIDSMIRNRPEDFTKVVNVSVGDRYEDKDGKIYFTVDSGKIQNTQESNNLKIGIIESEEGPGLDIYTKYIRVKSRGKTELFRIMDNESDIKTYERVSRLGKAGFLYEVYSDTKEDSVIPDNNYSQPKVYTDIADAFADMGISFPAFQESEVPESLPGLDEMLNASSYALEDAPNLDEDQFADEYRMLDDESEDSVEGSLNNKQNKLTVDKNDTQPIAGEEEGCD